MIGTSIAVLFFCSFLSEKDRETSLLQEELPPWHLKCYYRSTQRGTLPSCHSGLLIITVLSQRDRLWQQQGLLMDLLIIPLGNFISLSSNR